MTAFRFQSVPRRLIRSVSAGRHLLGSGLLLVGALLAALLVASGCGDRRTCFDAVDCGCHGREECILGCHGDGCDLVCGHTASSCGAICENDCRFDCHDTNHCSGLCGDDCQYRCRQTPSCAGECGARCAYQCQDVSECAVRVGPHSTVDCRSVALCDVTCDGPCEVSCTNVSRCDVRCATGLTRQSRSGGWSCQ